LDGIKDKSIHRALSDKYREYTNDLSNDTNEDIWKKVKEAVR
jgi:hypothetical protein